MIPRTLKPVAAILVFALVAYQPSLYAAAIPSKTAQEQTLETRATELVLARSLFATDRITTALAAEGLTQEQIEARLTLLSTSDLIALGKNPAQIKSAGISMSKRAWIITGVAAAVVIGAVALQSDDDEDDEGED